MIANHKKEHELFQRRLRGKWDKPFRLLRMLLAAAAECGEEYNETHHTSAVERDYVFEALVRLHARASLVGNEVLWLMEGGFASGALRDGGRCMRFRSLPSSSVSRASRLPSALCFTKPLIPTRPPTSTKSTAEGWGDHL